mmetsp:Transcript_133607/g.231709  ORF Transcript_133607/g.231709 Transcript_133607/m.231709 type:complete len:209 (+) Transcript_133607:3852-4478(+)
MGLDCNGCRSFLEDVPHFVAPGLSMPLLSKFEVLTLHLKSRPPSFLDSLLFFVQLLFNPGLRLHALLFVLFPLPLHHSLMGLDLRLPSVHKVLPLSHAVRRLGRLAPPIVVGDVRLVAVAQRGRDRERCRGGGEGGSPKAQPCRQILGGDVRDRDIREADVNRGCVLARLCCWGGRTADHGRAWRPLHGRVWCGAASFGHSQCGFFLR